MRAWVAQAVLGGAALAVSGVLFVTGLVHLLTEPRVPHHHVGAVMTAFLASMSLLGVSIAVLLEVRAKRRRASRTRHA
jgi:hypothetical protein